MKKAIIVPILMALFCACQMRPIEPVQYTPAQFEKLTKSEKLASLDAQIAYMEQQRGQMQLVANSYGRQADRLLFLDFLAARDYSLMQQKVLAQIAEVDNQLAALKAKRAQIQK